MNKNFVSAILIIIGIGIYFTITSSIIDSAKSVKAKNNQLTTALGSAEEIIKSRTDVTRQYNSIPEADRRKLDKMIPSSVDNIRLVIDLNNLALQNHFTLSDVKASVQSNQTSMIGSSAPTMQAGKVQSLSEPILDKIDVSFKAVATYEQFQDFLRDIEAGLRVMDLTQLSIKATDSGQYSYDVKFQTYWLRQ